MSFFWKMLVLYRFLSVHLGNVSLCRPAFPLTVHSSEEKKKKERRTPPPQIVTMPSKQHPEITVVLTTIVLEKKGQPIWLPGASALGC